MISCQRRSLNNVAKLFRNTIINGKSQTLFCDFFSESAWAAVHRLSGDGDKHFYANCILIMPNKAKAAFHVCH